MDVAAATAEFGLAPPEDGLVTPDGSTLAGLCGSATVQIRFHGNEKLHDITAQIIDKTQVTPLIGMQFWKPNKAQFDLANNTITISSQEEDGSTHVEVIACWCERDNPQHTAAAALHDHIAALQQAQQWNRSEHQDAELRPTTKSSNTLSTEHQEGIGTTLHDLRAQQQAAEANH